MRIKALDQDEVVGAKHIADRERFLVASHEPIPPLAGELGQLIELDDELLEDRTVATLTGEPVDAHNSEDNSHKEEDENDELIAMQLLLNFIYNIVIKVLFSVK